MKGVIKDSHARPREAVMGVCMHFVQNRKTPLRLAFKTSQKRYKAVTAAVPYRYKG